MKHTPQGLDGAGEPHQSSLNAPAGGDNELTPLAGEPGIPDIAAPSKSRLSTKGLLAVVLLLITLVAAAVLAAQRVTANARRNSGPESALTRDKPSAASTEPHRLELPDSKPRIDGPASASATSEQIPAIQPIAQDNAADAPPIGVRPTGAGTGSATNPKLMPPEDAPVLLVSTRASIAAPGSRELAVDRGGRAQADDDMTDASAPPDSMAATTNNLRDYQRRLQGLMDSLTQSAGMASKQAAPPQSVGALLSAEPPALQAQRNNTSAHGGLFGDQLQASATPTVTAAMLGDRSLTLPKGTAFTCALKTKVISATSGLIGCVLQRNLYGDDGRVLLVERGSHLDGEYRITSVKPGTVRIPVLWTRLRTPLGVTVELESPGTGQLGESGIDGYVDNRWGERIGAAMLLSLIDDSVKLVIQNQANERQGDTVVLPSTAANTSKLAEKVLDSTINIPPLVYQNQGGIVGIYVARDIDFSTVYALEPTNPGTTGAAKP